MKSEYITAAMLVILLFLVGNPFNIWMPSMLSMGLLLIVTFVFLLYVVFILKEKTGDERDLLHRMIAGRTAYLVGVTVLTAGLVIQGFLTHHIDPWILYALAAMVIAKFLSRAWAEKAQ